MYNHFNSGVSIEHIPIDIPGYLSPLKEPNGNISSSSFTSSLDKTILELSLFSVKYLTLFVPGIKYRSSPLANSQARATYPVVQFLPTAKFYNFLS